MNIKKLLKKIREVRKKKLLGELEKKEVVKPKVIPTYPIPPIQVKVKGKIEGEKEGEVKPIIIEYHPIKLPEKEENEIFFKDVSSLLIPKEIIEKLKKVWIETPLIEVELDGKKKLMAKSIIHWDPEKQSLIYDVIEPKLSEKEKEVLEKIKKYIEEKLDIDFTKIRNEEEAKKYIIEKFKEGIKRMGIKLNENQKFKIVYYLIRDLVGLEKIEPLMKDPNIEDISCDGVGLPVFIYHRDPMIGEIPTNIVFETREELDNFVIKLAQKCGRSISVAQPLLDGTLPDGSVDYDEPFIYRENGIVKITKIGEFVDKFYKDGEGNFPVKVEGIEVPAFDENLKITWRKVEYVYRHKINEDIYEIVLETGRRVRLTRYHSVFALKHGKVVPVRVDELKVGDYLVIPRRIPPNPVLKEINLAEYLENEKLWIEIPEEFIDDIFEKNEEVIMRFLEENYKMPKQAMRDLRKRYKVLPIKLWRIIPYDVLKKCKIKSNSSVRIKAVINVDEKLGKILGYYAAEGWLSKIGSRYRVEFCFGKDEKDVVTELCNLFEEVFGVKPRIYENNNSYKIRIESYVLYKVFKDVFRCGESSYDKKVPWILFNSEEKVIRAFLEAWWNGDRGYTVSERLASDIMYLHLMLGEVISFSRYEKTVTIDGRRVSSKGFYRPHKEIPKRYLEIPVLASNPITKVFPSLLQNERISRDRILAIIQSRFPEDIRSSPYIRRDLKIKGVVDENYELTEFGKIIYEEIENVKKLVNSDLAFVKIIEIRKVKPTKEWVYDVSVKRDENFVAGFGGVCCHNSRVQATFGTDIARRGSNFTIRKFFRRILTPVDLMLNNTADELIFAYFWLAVESRMSILIAGPTASGKTTMLNAISLFIRPEMKIISIEDSICEDAEVIIKDRDKIYFGKISEVFEELSKNHLVYRVGDREIIELFGETISVDENLRVVKGKVRKIIRRKNKKDVYEIVTESGKRIRVTGDHSLFTVEDGKLLEVEARNLKVGDEIVVFDFDRGRLVYSILETPKIRVKLEKIVEIKKIEYDGYVYDLEVERYENFFANGILCHNTAEIKLPHPNWVPHVSRAAFGPKGYGEVTMFDLLKAALRQRPDYIIVGEVRGREAYVMFQAMATGHAVLGTIHAENFDAIVNRLTTPPINLPKAMLTNLDIVTFMIGTKLKGKFVRRVDHIVEITGYDYKRDKILTNIAIHWDPVEDKFVRESSYLLSKIARRLGYTTEELYDEIRRRVLVLRWMKEKRITDYNEFWRIIGMYYYEPEKLMKEVLK